MYNIFRLHGTENLLHRATAGGSVPVVSELLKCGYRNVAAKDHDGQCAIHLAAFYGHVDVLGIYKLAILPHYAQVLFLANLHNL